jgi:crossover junction endodeoxyribonuclease RuvC
MFDGAGFDGAGFDGAGFDPDGPVLGIDPGVSRCGYGVVARTGSRMVATSYGVLRTEPSEELPVRLAALSADFDALIHEHHPSALAVERVLFQTNVRTAISVGQASGLALAAAARVGIPVVHYSPNEIKLGIVGHGGADKAQVQMMVMRLLELAEPPSPPDAADALALAVCHSWSAPLRSVASANAPGGGYDRAVAAALARDRERG